MIGKVIIGKSFGGCLRYCLEDKKMKKDIDKMIMKNRAEILQYNLCFGDKVELIQQFNEVRRLNAKQSKPVMHITLSFAPGEQLSKQQLSQIANHCAEDFGFDKNQFIAVEHSDTEHQHFHIVVNRINFDGKTLPDSNSYKRISDFCRKMEKRFQLIQVLSPTKFLPGDQKNVARHDQRKERLRTVIAQSLKSSKDFDEFAGKIKANSYQIIKGRGISFIDKQAVKVKGSELGFSMERINEQLKRNLIQAPKQTTYINLQQRKKSLHL
ncbi:MAG TPA: relaxase/mobilization nuclease domain-containing protein [Hanamia sp.]